MATFSSKPWPRKVTGPSRWNQVGLSGPGLKGHRCLSWQMCPGATGSCPIKEGAQWTPRSGPMAHLLMGHVLGKSLPDFKPQTPPLSDGLQFTLPIYSRPLGGSRERRTEAMLWEIAAPPCPALAPAQPLVDEETQAGGDINSRGTPEATIPHPGPRSPHL